MKHPMFEFFSILNFYLLFLELNGYSDSEYEPEGWVVSSESCAFVTVNTIEFLFCYIVSSPLQYMFLLHFFLGYEICTRSYAGRNSGDDS